MSQTRRPELILNDPVTAHVRGDFTTLGRDWTVGEALDHMRASPPPGRIIYFYVADADGRLVGVVPTRRLLLSAADAKVADVMIRNVIAVPASATVLEACEFFTLHRLLAFPVVDADRRMVGLIDVELYTEELVGDADEGGPGVSDDVFEIIGVHLTASAQAPTRAFRGRFPWLLCNIAAGLLAAVLAGVYQDVLTWKDAVLALFIPVVLALSESVSIQSVTLAVGRLRTGGAGNRALRDGLRESATGALLGTASAVVVAGAAAAWLGDVAVGAILLATIAVGVAGSAVIGYAGPTLLHKLRWNPQVAAGPVCLAAADMLTLAVYFNLARLARPGYRRTESPATVPVVLVKKVGATRPVPPITPLRWVALSGCARVGCIGGRAMSRGLAVAVTGFALATAGCVHSGAGIGRHASLALPAPGSVPGEMTKVMLPEYVIEPPDVLWLQVAVIARAGEPAPKADGKKDEGKEDEKGSLRVDQLRSLPIQPIQGDHTVRPDGTVFLGYYGAVPVAGYTLTQAAAAIQAAVARQVAKEAGGLDPKNLVVILDVSQYASKRYYVIFDGGGAGERVIPFPITGSETVLDAVANAGGLHEVASKRNVWVARRCPIPGHPEQILPVDWVGITQHGVAATNYQIMPGDRVYVKAQRLVTVDTTLGRILQPLERALGITLLGASTVNQVQGRGSGFGGN